MQARVASIMAPAGPTRRRFAAIVFTDIVGFSRLAERSETLALDLLEEQEGLVRRHLPAFSGREVKTIGDAFMLEFPSAADAVKCSIEIQKAMRERNALVGEDRRLLLRIGVHAGDIVERGGDLYGDGVNIAARVEPASPHGGVAISGSVRDAVAAEEPELAFEMLPTRPLKNIERTIELFRVVMPWDGAASPDGAVQDVEVPPVALSLADRWFGGGAEGGPLARPLKANRVVLVPLVNAGGDPDDDFIAEGLSEELAMAISFAGGLEVVGWDSAVQYAGRGSEPEVIAADLGAGIVLRGRVGITGGQAVFDLECLPGGGGEPHWTRHWEDDLRSMTHIYVDVAREVARVAGAGVLEGEVSRMERLGTTNPQARILGLRGSRGVKADATDEVQAARDRFMQAAELDGDWVMAHLGLARSFVRLGLTGRFPPNQMLMHLLPGALQASRRAVECGRFLSEAHAMEGLVRLVFTYDMAGAANELRVALDLKEASPTARLWYALTLAVLGRCDECDEVLGRARDLDPASPLCFTIGAYVLYASRRHGEAARDAEAGLKRHPHDWSLHALSGLAREASGDSAGAVTALRHAAELSGFHPMVIAALGYAQARAGDRDGAAGVLRELDSMGSRRFVPGWAAAIVHAGLGATELAMARLSEAHEEQSNWLVFLNPTPLLDGIRGEPAYQSLVERCGLVSFAPTA